MLESETHFLLHCNKYSILRQDLCVRARVHDPDFQFREDEVKLNILMSSELIRYTAKFLCQAFDIRQKCVYFAT